MHGICAYKIVGAEKIVAYVFCLLMHLIICTMQEDIGLVALMFSRFNCLLEKLKQNTCVRTFLVFAPLTV